MFKQTLLLKLIRVPEFTGLHDEFVDSWHSTLDRDISTNIYQENLNINVHIRVYKAISYFLPSSECWIDFTCWRAVNLRQWCVYNCYFTSSIPREQQCIAYTLNMLTSDEAMSTVGGGGEDSATRYLNDVLNLYHPPIMQAISCQSLALRANC